MAVANTSNISTIQILRSYANSAPLTLEDGQLAFSFLSNTLFIGSNTGSVIAISDQATANLARDLANTKVSKSGDVMSGSLQFFNSDFAIGHYQIGAGNGIDLWANDGTPYVQINYANTNFVYVDSGSAVIQSPNALIGADITGNATVTLTSGAYNNVWIFNKDSSLHFPDNSKQWTAAAPIAYTQAAFDTANNVAPQITPSFNQANSAYNQANTSLQNNINTSTSGVLYASGIVSNTSVTVNTSAVMTATSVVATTPVIVDTWATGTYGAAKYFIKMEDTSLNETHAVELIVIEANGSLNSFRAEFSGDEANSISGIGKSKYSLEYLNKFIKASKLSEKVKIRFSDDYPLRLDFPGEKMGIGFILAPRVESD